MDTNSIQYLHNFKGKIKLAHLKLSATEELELHLYAFWKWTTNWTTNTAIVKMVLDA